MSESGVMLLLPDDVGSYQGRSSDMRTESGELDLFSLRDPWGGGLEKKREGSGNRTRKR
jgi:hypothetical protein